MTASRKAPRKGNRQTITDEQIRKMLGEELFILRDRIVRELILARGGTGANVNHVGIWADRTLRLAAENAIENVSSAQKAVKIVKQAKRLGEKY